jgi:hypothetical protein
MHHLVSLAREKRDLDRVAWLRSAKAGMGQLWERGLCQRVLCLEGFLRRPRPIPGRTWPTCIQQSCRRPDSSLGDVAARLPTERLGAAAEAVRLDAGIARRAHGRADGQTDASPHDGVPGLSVRPSICMSVSHASLPDCAPGLTMDPRYAVQYSGLMIRGVGPSI